MKNNVAENSNKNDICRKRVAAQKRWKILAYAVTRSTYYNREIDSQKHDGYDLTRGIISSKYLKNDLDGLWFEYYLNNCFGKQMSVIIRQLNRLFTAYELIGFNNTGNICVWQSEKCLAAYIIRHPEICCNCDVLELGGGMTCLAGLFAAVYCDIRSATLTDGNSISLQNVSKIIEINKLEKIAKCERLAWGPDHEQNSPFNKKRNAQFDVILCADCLFFEESMLKLVETIYNYLKDDGIALIMAPKRGNSFQKFFNAAVNTGLSATTVEQYDEAIWLNHQELLKNQQNYNPDVNFPILLKLSK